MHTVRPGGAVIQATIDNVTGHATLSVIASVASVMVQAGDDSVRPGGSLQFSATLLDHAGRVLTAPAVSWSSSDTTTAMVSAVGLVRGLTTGNILIFASAEGVSGSRSLRVMAPVDTVAILPASVTLGTGVSFPFRVRLVDSIGVQFDSLVVAWASNSPTIATIDTGELSALKSGVAVVTATAERRTGSATATVRKITFAMVGPGDAHTCAVSTDQVAFCWGVGGGRLGDSSTTTVGGPVAVAGGQTYVQVGSGVDHSCGLLVTGEAFCWGNNIYGQLGKGGIPQSTYPVAVEGGLTFRSIHVSYFHSCGLTNDSLAYCWGDGYGTAPVAVPGNLRFSVLSAGGAHVCGLIATGAAYCWGANDDGRLGDSTQIPRTTPVAVVGGLTFTDISAGGYHTCALTAAGTAYCWGSGRSGQIGSDTAVDNNLSPVAVHGGLQFSALATGLGNSCGLVTGGQVYCWGDNASGESGPNGGPQVGGGRSLVPVPVGITASAIAAGTKHVCALTASGLFCWGSDASGELGDEKTVDSAVPVRVVSQP